MRAARTARRCDRPRPGRERAGLRDRLADTLRGCAAAHVSRPLRNALRQRRGRHSGSKIILTVVADYNIY